VNPAVYSSYEPRLEHLSVRRLEEAGAGDALLRLLGPWRVAGKKGPRLRQRSRLRHPRLSRQQRSSYAEQQQQEEGELLQRRRLHPVTHRRATPSETPEPPRRLKPPPRHPPPPPLPLHVRSRSAALGALARRAPASRPLEKNLLQR
jgi:hypothetical protein